MADNTEQIAYWNDKAGPTWVTAQAHLDAQLGPIGLAAIDHLAPRAGERIIDVGCGCGDTTLQLAERVAPGGHVAGIDVSGPMLDHARSRAGERSDVTFTESDAAEYDFESIADGVFSRFGVMFFVDPLAAFVNIRTALRPGGRLTFASWQEAGRNAWLMVPIGVVAQHLPLPEPPEPGAPGPFAFADAGRVHTILADAGFESIESIPHDTPLTLAGGASLDDAVTLMLSIGPAAQILRENDATPAVREAVAADMRAALEGYATPDGVTLDSAAWIVSAAAPA